MPFKWKPEDIETQGTTLWIWGANLDNYLTMPGKNLDGGGMAGPNGPTRGIARAQYVGIPTTKVGGHSVSDVLEGIKKTVKRVRSMVTKKGYDCIILPVHTDHSGKVVNKKEHGLGKGLAVGQNGAKDQEKIQDALKGAIQQMKKNGPRDIKRRTEVTLFKAFEAPTSFFLESARGSHHFTASARPN